jgi:hypothetical protein
MKKYQLPEFLTRVLSQDVYERWLHRKGIAHVRRDRKRGSTTARNAEYKLVIHQAVKDSKGLDAYTREKLDWTLISKWRNKDAKSGGSKYKKRFALLPTVDHVGDRRGQPNFAICGWRTNDAKNDLTYLEFLKLCKKVLTAAKKL